MYLKLKFIFYDKVPDSKEINVGEPFTVKANLTNPLPVPLRKCQFLIDGPGLGEPLKIKLSE